MIANTRITPFFVRSILAVPPPTVAAIASPLGRRSAICAATRPANQQNCGDPEAQQVAYPPYFGHPFVSEPKVVHVRPTYLFITRVGSQRVSGGQTVIAT